MHMQVKARAAGQDSAQQRQPKHASPKKDTCAAAVAASTLSVSVEPAVGVYALQAAARQPLCTAGHRYMLQENRFEQHKGP